MKIRAWPIKLLLFLLPFCALFLYKFQLLEANAYYGFVDIKIDCGFWLVFFIWQITILCLYPVAIKYPSNVFEALYLSIVSLFGSVFWASTGLLNVEHALTLLVLLVLPIVVLKSLRQLTPDHLNNLPFRIKILPERHLPVIIITMLIIVVIMGYQVSGGSGGLAIDSMYERRMAARENFAGKRFYSYLLIMSLNGLAPFLAFIGGLQKNYLYIGASILFSFFIFWLIGVKGSFLYVVSMCIFGFFYARKGLRKFSYYIVFALAGIFIIALIEYWTYGYSYIADYFIRRAFLVASQIQTYFIDQIFLQGSFDEILFGVNTGELATPSFLIGYKYFGNEAVNANTNAFIYSFALSGLLGYLVCTVFIGIFMLIMDSIFSSTKKAELFAISTIYSFLLLEQAYTTAFVSSGICLCLLLLILFSKNDATHVMKMNS